MSELARKQDLSDEELSRRGMVMIFLSVIGGQNALDSVIQDADVFWRQQWGFIPYHLRDWITRATQLPLDYFVNASWSSINCDAQKHIVKKTRHMAIRAKSLIVGVRNEVA